MGVTVLGRALVEAPLRVLGPSYGLPALPAVEVAYAFGRRSRARVVSELALFLAELEQLRCGEIRGVCELKLDLKCARLARLTANLRLQVIPHAAACPKQNGPAYEWANGAADGWQT
jgi:hypothetical protein